MRELARKSRNAAHPSPTVARRPLANFANDSSQQGLGTGSFALNFTAVPTHGSAPICVQPKLTVGATNDPAEHEADRIAGQVMRLPEAGGGHPPSIATMAGNGVGVDAPPIVHDVLNSTGQPLDAATRAFFEPRFGRDFSNVRVHTDAAAERSARDIRAIAYTAGSHIAFRDGAYSPRSSGGSRLLGHELAHVVQQQAAGAPRIQRQTDDAAAAVKRVKSPTVKEASKHVDETQGQLDARIAKRAKEISELLEQIGEPKSQKGKDRKAALEKDLTKSLDDIVATPDSKGVNPDLRKDIIASSRTLTSQNKRLDKVKSEWGQYDSTFASADVASTLGTTSVTPAELKALVAQESGDLTENDQEGDIAGIAQMGSEEEKRAGGKPGDRKDAQKAIRLAAKIMALYAADLDKALTAQPQGIERKKFIMAAYNGGVNLIVQAQKEAIAMKLSGTTWSSLVNGDKNSPLYKAIAATYKANKVESKYAEVKGYIEKIYARLP